MRLPLKIFLIIISFIIFSLIPARAEIVTVSATVKDTALILSGYTSPNTMITFFEGNVVLGTTSSNASGYFWKKLDAIVPGIHEIRLESTDIEGTPIQPVSFNLILLAKQEMDISNIYLPPTIHIHKADYKSNEIISVHGYTKPNSTVKVTFENVSSNYVYTSTSNSSGYYDLILPLKQIGYGNFTIYSNLSIDDIIDNSTKSSVLSFKVSKIIDDALSPTEQPEDDTDNECFMYYYKLCHYVDKEELFVIQRDKFVEYLNGYIKYYNHYSDNLFDINNDKIVNNTDLSIFLYYWRGDTKSIIGNYSANTIETLAENDGRVKGEQVSFGDFWHCLSLILLLILLVIYLKYRKKLKSFLVDKWIIILVLLLSLFAYFLHTNLVTKNTQLIITDNSTIDNVYTYNLELQTINNINLSEILLKFNNDDYKLIKVDFAQAYSSIIINSDYSNEEGYLSLVAGAPYPGFIGNGLVAKISFEKLNEGELDLKVLNSSKLYKNDGHGSSIEDFIVKFST